MSSGGDGGRGSIWTEEETNALIAVWGQDDVQSCLDGVYRNASVYEEISDQLREIGYDRNAAQCRGKIKALKIEYKKLKTGQQGHAKRWFKYYEELDAILSRRPKGDSNSKIVTSSLSDVKGAESEQSEEESSGSGQNFSPSVVQNVCSQNVNRNFQQSILDSTSSPNQRFLQQVQEVEIEDKTFIGISIKSGNNIPKEHTSLGMVVVPKSYVESSTISQLRQTLSSQIRSLPSSFIFCTVQGSLSQKLKKPPPFCIDDTERLIGALNGHEFVPRLSISKISQKYFDVKPKVGIKTKTEEALGFIFVEYTSLLSRTREIIDKKVLNNRNKSGDYWFIDPNGWPVSYEQERELCVMDITSGSCLQIDGKFTSSATGSCSSVDLYSPPQKRLCKSLTGARNLSFRTSKDIERCQVADSSVDDLQTGKQILISYVRADAAHHALELKQELSNLGYSVYLDVHEIQSGVDWQDSLNFAVSTCEVFVPLVTPRYGETRWTNREVKLADVLGKNILPVSFLEEWPPRCLAIQFATTQFINWKTPAQIQKEVAEGFGDKAEDINFWDKKYVEMVAMEIGERLEGFPDLNISKVPSLTKRKTVVKSCACVEESNPSAVTTDRDGCPLIVICVHPNQTDCGQEMKMWLEEKKYEVWCSTDLDINYPDTLSNSQGEISLSQISQQGMPSDLELDNRQKFQEKADDAGIIIFIISQDFVQSKTCQQQVFYCEQRKRTIPVKYGEFECPGWMSMLIGKDTWEEIGHVNYKESLFSRLERKLDPCTRDSVTDDINEAKIMYRVRRLKKTLSTVNCVYIAGSTEFHCDKSADICRSIGTHLASLDSVSLVTGGFHGVGESVGQAFCEETQRLWKNHKVWHILPEKDSKDRSRQAVQNADGTFQIINYGKTLFYGDSVKERESIAARTFDICILIEGGPGAAHEAEEFTWNDHIVIPIQCTGGAAGGEFNVPQKIFEIPQGVKECDWSVLSNKDVTADMIGHTVKKIVICLQRKLDMENRKMDISPKGKSPKSVLKPVSPSGQKSSLTSMKTVIINDGINFNS